MGNKQSTKQNSGTITSFFFYEDYAAAITELTDKDAGEFIKLFGANIFDKKQTKTTDSKAAKLFTLLSLNVNTTAKQTSNDVGVLNFTQKEILRMPKTFRKEFKTAGCTARVYKRKSGKETWNYVICYRRNGYNVIACSNNLAEAKRKFIDKLIQEDALRRAMEVNRAAPAATYYYQQQAAGATPGYPPQQTAAYYQPQQPALYISRKSCQRK